MRFHSVTHDDSWVAAAIEDRDDHHLDLLIKNSEVWSLPDKVDLVAKWTEQGACPLPIAKLMTYMDKIKPKYETLQDNFNTVMADDFDEKLKEIFKAIYRLSRKYTHLTNINYDYIPDGSISMFTVDWFTNL